MSSQDPSSLDPSSPDPVDSKLAPKDVSTEPSKVAKNVGGQAVIEGVMMRGRDRWAVMVREPDGRITGQTKSHKAWNGRWPWKYPFIRGIVILIESLVLGIKALNYSTEVAVSNIEEQEKALKEAKIAEKKAAKLAKEGAENPNPASDSPDGAPALVDSKIFQSAPEGDLDLGVSQAGLGSLSAQSEVLASENASGAEPSDISEATESTETTGPTEISEISDLAAGEGTGQAVQKASAKADRKKSHALEMVIGLVFGLGLGLFLFVALPHLFSFILGQIVGFDETTFLFHFLDGLIKFFIFVAYVYLIGLYPDVARIYAYHGAEHQAIYVYEAGLPFEPSSAKNFPTWHPRCGTAFMFLVLAASLLFFAIIFPLLPSFDGLSRVPRILTGVGIKILCTPFLAALAYEVAKMAARANANPIWKAMVWPGLLLQRLTTRNPDDSMLEVAFKSLEAVIPAK
ncbi:MAG: DUF1385 domain-containing protein [Deltaproteobacteria bacterium]|nr:DUF1385 domain-containing protein [Deltaproteobacteria bacterium]